MIKRLVLNIATSVSILLEVTTCRAFDYDVVPSGKVSMRADDNIRGSSNNPETALGFDSGGSVRARAQSEVLKSDISPHVNFRRFIVGENLDADEYGVSTSTTYAQERYGAGLDFSYSRDSTLSTESTDTGVVNSVTDRDSISASPSVSYSFNERLGVQGRFLYSSVSYVDAAATGFIDYDYIQGSVGVSYFWRDNIRLFSNFNVSQFDTGDGASSTRSYSDQVGAAWQVDESLDVSGSVGWNQSYIDFLDQQLALVLVPVPHFEIQSISSSSASGGLVANATIFKRFDRAFFKLDYLRQNNPTGRGAQSSSDHITINSERRLTDSVSLQLSGVYDIQSAQGTELGGLFASRGLNRDYQELNCGVRYRIRSEWTISGLFRYARRATNSGTRSVSSDSKTLIFALEYNGNPYGF